MLRLIIVDGVLAVAVSIGVPNLAQLRARFAHPGPWAGVVSALRPGLLDVNADFQDEEAGPRGPA
ncbi:hypothetical protein F1D05_10515 [Kribbella qitaiheensis]|uniref:Uncharacterized protein n=1 Tax=Kribbella qitaiheensis TaxID=1544730 RepID=A0A7G6WW86_9ACTN|nr:hypothetical protein [Kribbella qitaiheensis]QNE18251.1 hypothetical protein F1D05_10515 [Kribbella qitaiheensis]